MGITLESIKTKMVGKTFGKLTVRKYLGKNERGDNLWYCICECGAVVIGRTANVCKPNSGCNSCKRHSGPLSNKQRSILLGKTFGRLTVLSYDRTTEHHAGMWKCRCECGNEVSVRTHSLTGGITKSCGCYGRERASVTNLTHGYAKHPLYAVYWAMKERCCNPNSYAYVDYGERGIQICDEWLFDFMEFFSWAMWNGYQKDLTIERIDNHGNYEPGNCRWATQHEQMQNTRRTRLNSEQVKAIRDDSRVNSVIAKEYGVDTSTISRVKANRTWHNIG